MRVPITMPQLGLTMTEGTVGEWLKKPGDTVKKDETILIVSTDKVEMEIEATVEGILRNIVVEQGQTVPVGTALAYVDAVGEDPPDVSTVHSPSANAPGGVVNEAAVGPWSQEAKTKAFKAKPGLRSEQIKASPRARKLARQLGVDISTVKGSGPNGLIVERDLLILGEAQDE